MCPFISRSDIFRDRAEAGRKLAERLRRYRADRPVVLGIPRGGVVVAQEIARRLEAPLDVVVVRKVGDPANPEYGLGAVAESVRLTSRGPAKRGTALRSCFRRSPRSWRRSTAGCGRTGAVAPGSTFTTAR